MVEIGGRPIIWHIMKCYAQYGLTDFIVLGGYGRPFARDIVWSASQSEPWRVTVLDTGLDGMTGGRMNRARQIIGDETFCLTKATA
jgi:glucose-1-phosphate cytidylyltransferase